MADERKIGTVEIDRLYDFLDGLQANGYTIDPRQYLALSDLLMALIARGDSLEEAPLKTMIASLICSTPAEQQDFYQRFDRWYPTLLPVKQASLSGDGAALPPTPKRRWSLPTINRTAVIWVTVVVAVITLIVWLISNSAATGTPVINNTVLLYGTIFAVFSFMVWLGWRASILYQENQYITRELANQEPVYTKVPVKAYIQDIMPVMQFMPIVSALRKRTQVPSSEVDVDKTIENALNRDNWLEIVYRQRQVMPEYVVLIDRKSRLDQQARFVQEVLAKLAADGVWLHQYEFSGDPRICFPLDRKDTPLRLKDLHARHPDSRLLIFSGTNELINPLTGLLQDWLESLSYWQERAILTPDKLQKVLLEELQSRDFAVLPMTFDGLASLVRAFETDNVPLLTNGGADLPAQLTERPMRWTGRDVPPEAEVKALVEDVKNYLGENGFYWLCATSVYPELRWELTLHLGSALKDDSRNSLLNPDTLIRLAQLPWFRFGYAPDWMRSTLINRFSSDQENQVRNVLSELLSSAYKGEDFDLVFSRSKSDSFNSRAVRFLNALIRKSPDESTLRDHLFVKFIVKPGARKLSVALTSELTKRFSNVKHKFSYTRVSSFFDLSTISLRIGEFTRTFLSLFGMRGDIRTNKRLKVVLAYASQDKDKALEIYKKLSVYEWIEPWIGAEELLGGDDWRLTIEQTIEEANVVLVCLSNISITKEGYVQREIHYALDISMEKPAGTTYLLPILLEKCEIPRSLKDFKNFYVPNKNEFSEMIDLLQKRLEQINSYESPYNVGKRQISLTTQLNRPLKIFLSYSHTDLKDVQKLYERLKKDGMDVWFDRKIVKKDQSLRFEVQKAISESDVMIVCQSNQFYRDMGALARISLDELISHPDGKIFVIPIRLNDCRTLESLRRLQWVDLFLPDGYERLLKSLRVRSKQIAAKLNTSNIISYNEINKDLEIYDNKVDKETEQLSPYPQSGNERLLKVFIAHSSKDKEESKRLYTRLLKQGASPWLDLENLRPGVNQDRAVAQALNEADVILVCFSSRSHDDEGFVSTVKSTLDRALEIPEGSIFTIPVRFDDCELPHSLRILQPGDLFVEDGIERLMESLNLRADQLSKKTITVVTNEWMQEVFGNRRSLILSSELKDNARILRYIGMYFDTTLPSEIEFNFFGATEKLLNDFLRIANAEKQPDKLLSLIKEGVDIASSINFSWKRNNIEPKVFEKIKLLVENLAKIRNYLSHTDNQEVEIIETFHQETAEQQTIRPDQRVLKNRILIVDNDRVYLETLMEFFENEFNVTIANNLKDALQIIQGQKTPFHVVINGLRLMNDDDPKDESGLDLLKEIKRRGDNTQTILLTLYPTVESARKALREYSAYDYVSKSSGMEELREIVRKAAGQSALEIEKKGAHENTELETTEIAPDAVDNSKIRPLNILRDLPAVADLIELCYSSTMDSEDTRYLQDMRRAGKNSSFITWASRAAENTSLPLTGYVWEEEGNIIGNVSLVPFQHHKERIYLIANIAVLPKHRRKGIARALTERAMQHAREKKVNNIWLHVRTDNREAVELFAKLGFIERARRTSWQAPTNVNSPRLEADIDITITVRRPHFWAAQLRWLSRLYPDLIAWYRSWDFNYLRPGFWNWFYLSIVDKNILQWAAVWKDQLQATLSWIPKGRGEGLFVAAGEDCDPEAITALLLRARYELHNLAPHIMLEFPVGQFDDSIVAAGFTPLRTLIWMQAS